MNKDHCKKIHQASLELLRRTGVRVHHEEAKTLLKDSGCPIEDGNLAKIPPSLVEGALDSAPSVIALCSRGTDFASVLIQSGVTTFGPGSDCPYYLDPRNGERRPFTLSDLNNCARLADALPEIGFLMSMGIPRDFVGNAYRKQYAMLVENSAKPVVFVCNDEADCRAIVAAASVLSGGMDRLRLNPTLLLYSEPTTPLQHSRTATEKLLYMAAEALPVVHSPAPMMGSTAPATLAAGLVLGNAEVLSGLVIHQLKRAGAPFLYGSGLHHMDMRTSISVYGAPEFQLARLAVAAMGGYYGLPTWGYAGHSDAIPFDEQAAVDAALSVQNALLCGMNLVHDVGYLEAGLITSPEMMVFTADMIGMLRHFASGFSLEAESLALDVMHRVGPGGNYLAEEHTLRHYREFWQPVIFDRQRYEAWNSSGAKSFRDRLREKTLDLMAGQSGAILPHTTCQEIERVLCLSD
jgi:trimethylamine--corrinoid protein Co-methyltransferase